MHNLLVDTDVLIDYLRGNKQAKQYFDKLSESVFVSSITVAELYAGVREGNERSILEELISYFKVVSVDPTIATKGGLYRRDYHRIHGTGLADALIAATAYFIPATLVTLNKKHFPMLKNVIVPYHKRS